MTAPHAPAGPRITSLDATRGLALLGIMLVNVHYFTDSLNAFYSSRPHLSGGPVPTWIDEACFFFQRALCEGKFFPLYSLMFGAGMVLILQGVAARGGRFWTVYLRRLAVLALIGLFHGFFIWFGDILFVYALLGLLLLALGPLCSGRTLAIIGACLIAVGVVLSISCLSLSALGMAHQPPPLPDSIASLPPGERLIHGYGIMRGPHHPAYTQIELEAYSHGPFLQAQIVRSIEYVSSIVMGLLFMGPTIAGMFLLGAGLMKLRFWTADEAAPLHRRLLTVGLAVGLPASLGGMLLARFGTAWGASVGLAITTGFGPLLTLGIAAAMVMWVNSGRAPGLPRLLAIPGRMGLTNYLLTSVLMTFVSYHWGLGLWGRFGAAAQVGLCLLVYALLIAFSAAWQSRYAVGPVEWLWKSASYLRAQPLRRTPRGEQSPA